MSGGKYAKKEAYLQRVNNLFTTYNKILLVNAQNVGSAQMQSIRSALRGKAVLLMGKNTMIRRGLRGLIGDNPKLEKLMPHLVGNRGMIFTNEDPAEIRAIVAENRVGAPAKAGAIAPVDVIVPAGPTGMEPNLTSFFQALNIATKISRGQIEIVNEQHLIEVGAKVTASEAVLLQRLGIKPFSYGLESEIIYDDGTVFAASILDLTEDDLIERFVNAANDIGAIGLAISYPTTTSVPHSIIKGFLNILNVSIGSEYTIKQAEGIREFLENPEAFAAAAPAAAEEDAAAGGDDGDDSDSSSGAFGFDMFG